MKKEKEKKNLQKEKFILLSNSNQPSKLPMKHL